MRIKVEGELLVQKKNKYEEKYDIYGTLGVDSFISLFINQKSLYFCLIEGKITQN
jgi:hypothetical protein